MKIHNILCMPSFSHFCGPRLCLLISYKLCMPSFSHFFFGGPCKMLVNIIYAMYAKFQSFL